MRNVKKTIFALFACLCLSAASLTACGDKPHSTSSSTSDNSSLSSIDESSNSSSNDEQNSSNDTENNDEVDDYEPYWEQEHIPESVGLRSNLSEDESAYEVSGIGTCKDKTVVIPKTHNDLPVTAIADGAFWDKYELIGVQIPDSVTYIGKEAFWNCTSLDKVIMPDSVTTVAERAFHCCGRLQAVKVGKNVQ